VEPRLFAGPPLAGGPESLHDHTNRLGPLPLGRPDLIHVLEASGLLGRGGASFPAGRKWRAVAQRAGGDARVLANGAEGEPLSGKDRTIMSLRPHLVLDGALLAADAVGAREIVLYVGAAHGRARAALDNAMAERRAAGGGLHPVVRLVAAPDAYVAGEESAAVHFINEGDARPTSIPPRPFEKGIAGRPTLVQNVETLAHVALIARHGDAWYRAAGHGATRGSALVTLDGVARPGVREIALGTPIEELATLAGATREGTVAVLLGGYFGTWLTRDEAWALSLDPVSMRAAGLGFGAGVVSFLGTGRCGVVASAAMLDYLASQSAAQCGPCVFGLRAIADALAAVVHGRGSPADLDRVARWGGQLTGRGACRHPDGAAGLLASALRVFGTEFAFHAQRRRCTAGSAVSAVRAA
jgi:NADH:ubiquinone oxidoreductase subunit F (NADH-binding)